MGEFPGWEEKRDGKPFVGKAGEIARVELGRAGIALWQCRVTNLWMHDPSPDERDRDWNLMQAIKALSKCKYILIFGSSAAEAVFNEKVSEISGLRLASPLFMNATIVVASPNPAAAGYGAKGEIEWSLHRFKEWIDAEQ